MNIGTSLNFAASSREGALELKESLELIKNAGFEAVEIDLSRGVGAAALEDADWEEKLASIKATVEETGLKIASAHAPHDPRLYIPELEPAEAEKTRFADLLCRSAKAAQILGAPILVVHPVDNLIDAEYDSEVNLETNKKHLAEVVRESEKCGVKIAVENVYYSSAYRYRRRYGESAEEVITLADSIGAGVCWNCGHAHPVTMDQARAIGKIGSRLVLMHLSDSRGHTDAGLPPMIGGGNIKWEQIMPAVAKLGFEGYAILQADQYINNMPRALQPDAARFARTVCHRLEELGK